MNPIPWIAVAVLTRLLNPVASPDSGWQLPADTTDAILANDNRAPAGRLANGVLTLKLELRLGSFRPEGADGPSVSVLAFAEAGRPLQIPGPLLRVPQGTDIRVTVRNPFKDSTLTVYGLGSRPLRSDTGVAIPGGRSGRSDSGPIPRGPTSIGPRPRGRSRPGPKPSSRAPWSSTPHTPPPRTGSS